MTRAKVNTDPAFSLDAMRKESREGAEPFVLLIDGHRLTMPSPKDIDIESLSEWAALNSSGDTPEATAITAGLKALLGDNYHYVKEARVTVSEAAAIFDAWAKHYGVGSAGESSASSSS